VIDPTTLLLFMLNGFLGAFVHVLMWARNWRQILAFESVKALIIGCIAGYVYYFLHVSYNFPDSVIAIVVGYSAKDFFQWFTRYFSPKKPSNYDKY